MKKFQKDIKSKLKNLLVIGCVAGAYLLGRQASNNQDAQNLQNQSNDFAKKEVAYKEKIKDLQAAKAEFRFYDINADGLRNSLIDSLNYRRYQPLKKADYSGFELFVPGEKELKHAVSHLKPLEERSFERLEKQKKILIHKINNCPEDSAELFFKSCNQYRRVLIKEMAMLHDRNAGRLMYLNLPEKYVVDAFNAAGKKLGPQNNEYQNLLIAGEMRFMEDVLAVRDVVAINNEAIKVFQSKDSLKAAQHQKNFNQQQRIRRAAIVDSLKADRELKRREEVQKFLPMQLFQEQKFGWHCK